MSCFIIIHISPYLYHSDAWPLSHFLTKTHICLVLQSIKEYFVLFWVMYYHLADIFFMSPERISILCCLYSKIAGNLCILLALAWQLADCSKCTLCLEKSHDLNEPNEDCEKDVEEEELKTSAVLAVTLWWKVQYRILQSMQAKNCRTLFTV